MIQREYYRLNMSSMMSESMIDVLKYDLIEAIIVASGATSQPQLKRHNGICLSRQSDGVRAALRLTCKMFRDILDSLNNALVLRPPRTFRPFDRNDVILRTRTLLDRSPRLDVLVMPYEILTPINAMNLSNLRLYSLHSKPHSVYWYSLDLAPVAALQHLSCLSLNNVVLTNLSPITSLSSLKRLVLNNCFNVTSRKLGPLVDCKTLKEVGIWHDDPTICTSLKSLSFLRRLPLDTLRCSNLCGLASLPPDHSWTGLKVLDWNIQE